MLCKKSVFYHIVLNDYFNNFISFSSSLKKCICEVVVAAYCLLPSDKKVKHCMTWTLFCRWVHLFLCWFTKMFQCDTLNRHRSISTVILLLYLMGKTINYLIGKITATYHILKWFAAFKLGLKIVAIVICTQYVYTRKAEHQLLNCCNIETFMKNINYFLHDH